MIATLPPHATPESKRRYELARSVVEACSGLLGGEIALTGSVARGIADGFSDIELNLWYEHPVPDERYLHWLREVGVEGVTAADVSELDGTRWVTGRLRGVWVEVGEHASGSHVRISTASPS